MLPSSFEASPWFSTPPRQANRAGKLPVDADELSMLKPSRHRSPHPDHLRPRRRALQLRGELLNLPMHSISSNSFGSSFHTGHCWAPPFGHAAGDAPTTKSERRYHHLTRLDPLNLFPAIRRSNLQRIIGLEHDLWAQASDDIIPWTSQRFWLGLCLGGIWPGHWSTSQW
jgi:hypothetical protein